MNPHTAITVSLNHRDGAADALNFRAVSPEQWESGDTHALLHAIYHSLRPQALIRLHVARCDDPDCYRLEIVCDTGSATTTPLHLSADALNWLQLREFGFR